MLRSSASVSAAADDAAMFSISFRKLQTPSVRLEARASSTTFGCTISTERSGSTFTLQLPTRRSCWLSPTFSSTATCCSACSDETGAAQLANAKSPSDAQNTRIFRMTNLFLRVPPCWRERARQERFASLDGRRDPLDGCRTSDLRSLITLRVDLFDASRLATRTSHALNRWWVRGLLCVFTGPLRCSGNETTGAGDRLDDGARTPRPSSRCNPGSALAAISTPSLIPNHKAPATNATQRCHRPTARGEVIERTCADSS